MRTLLVLSSIFALVLGTSTLAVAGDAPDTLVVQSGDGFAPGAAASWQEEGGAVIFTLVAGVDAAGVAATLSDRLAAAKVTVEGGKVKVAGVPAPALLDQLSSLSLSGEGGDPLADLAGLGGAVAMDTPEGGGSIRASNPGGMAPPRVIAAHDPKERVQAEVVAVTRGQFPYAVLKLKLRSTVKAGPLKKLLRKGKTIDAAVIVNTAAGNSVDFAAEPTQRNVVAFYLAKGDRVTVHAVAADKGKLVIDFVERDK